MEDLNLLEKRYLKMNEEKKLNAEKIFDKEDRDLTMEEKDAIETDYNFLRKNVAISELQANQMEEDMKNGVYLKDTKIKLKKLKKDLKKSEKDIESGDYMVEAQSSLDFFRKEIERQKNNLEVMRNRLKTGRLHPK